MAFEIAKFDIDKAARLASAFAQSGYFADAKDAQKALVKIIAGSELSIGPMASMTGIHVIQGKPAVGSGIMAAKVKGSGKYDYVVNRLDDEGCELEFFEREGDSWSAIGKSAFVKADATRANLLNRDNWKAYPRNMYFSRAMSNGVRWYCPDAMQGGPVYTPEELGADVDEQGEVVIEAEARVLEGPRSRGQVSDVNELLEDGHSNGSGAPVPTEVLVEHARVVDEDTGEITGPEPDGVVLDILAALDGMKGDTPGLANLWNTELMKLPAEIQAQVRPRFDELMAAARPKRATQKAAQAELGS